MEQKKVSRCLIMAGALAALCGGFLFFVYAPIAAGQCREMYPELAHLYLPGLLAVEAIGLTYAGAMAEYFRIVVRIGQDRSFCRENARGLSRIARFMAAAGFLWALLLILPPLIWQVQYGAALFAMLLAAAASFAMGVLAWGLGKLLARAVALKEENDLTV